MIGTLFSILTALFVIYNPIAEMHVNFELLSPFLILIPLLFLFLETIALSLAWAPLQKSSKSITPHLFNLLKNDKKFLFISGLFFLFILYSLWFSSFGLIDKRIGLAIWLILFGISFDSLKYLFNLISAYINPFEILEIFKKAGIKDIQDSREIDLCDRFDALTETSVGAIKSTKPSLSNASLNVLQLLSRVFLESQKSISHENKDAQTEALGIQDKVSYVLSYLFQKIDFIFNQALNAKLEPVLSFIVTSIGKITLHAAKYDMSLTMNPLIYLGKYATKSVANQFPDVGVRSTLTLLEVAKTMVTDIDLTYQEIQEPFLCLISQLESIAKESFKQDKGMQIGMLLQPFVQLKELFMTDKIKNHQDTPVITKDLDRVIAEFQMLETVMRTIPPIPK